MKSYPSIPTKIVSDTPIYLFDKLDGSNIRAEWNKKRGFYKYGSRTRLIDENSSILGESIPLINENYADELTKRFQDKKYESAVCFFEFYGESSFAGSHAEEDHKVTLFDIDAYKVGLLPPQHFLDITEGLDIAKLLYSGVLTVDIVLQIQAGTFEGLTFEGVVGKYVAKNQIKMLKIKNRQWVEKLKQYCGPDVRLYEQLL